VLRRALAKNREERYASAAALAEALRQARQETRERVPADTTPTARVAQAVPPAPPGPAIPTPTPPDRRRATRLDIPVNFMIRRVDGAGKVLEEHQTYAENVGRGGARVMTTMTALAPGDIVHLEEIGGLFKTRAEVRGSYVGKDHVRRLNLRFLDSPAPDYLVHVDYSR
jgi:hypothetical protein